MKKIISTNNMNTRALNDLTNNTTNEESDVIKNLSTHYLKDAEKLGYTLADLINMKTRRKIIEEVERGDARNPKRILSNRYLKDAKRLGYTWKDLLNKNTRQKVINKVIEYKFKKTINEARKTQFDDIIRDARIQQMEDEVKREHFRQMEEKIKREHQRIIRRRKQTQRKQTADVLIFQRYDIEKDIPKDRRIAFRDHRGKPYIMRIRPYFIIDKINTRYANRYIGKRVYDYQDDINGRDDFDRVVELLKTSEDFKDLYTPDYINCIIIKSLTNTNNTTKANDLLDEDLFMVFSVDI